jgi:hypothetical protein
VAAPARRVYGRRSLWLLLVTCVAFQGLALFAALHFSQDYFHPWLAPAACSAQVAIACGLAWSAGRGPKPRAAAIAMLFVVAAAATVALDTRAQGSLGFANWAFGLTVLPLGLAALHLPIRTIAFAVAAHDLVQTAIIADRVGFDLPSLDKLGAILLLNIVLQIGLGRAFALLMSTADVTAEAVWRSELTRTRLLVDQLLQRARSLRAHEIDGVVRSLFSAVVDGGADPSDPAVRRRFTAVMSIMQRGDALSRVASDVRRLTEVAERVGGNGVRLEIVFWDKLDNFPSALRETMLELAAAALELAAPGQVVLAAHNDEDLTIADRGAVDPAQHHSVHSLTMSLHIEAELLPTLRAVIKQTSEQDGTRVRTDLEVDVDDATGERPEDVFAWLAVAGR